MLKEPVLSEIHYLSREALEIHYLFYMRDLAKMAKKSTFV